MYGQNQQPGQNKISTPGREPGRQKTQSVLSLERQGPFQTRDSMPNKHLIARYFFILQYLVTRICINFVGLEKTHKLRTEQAAIFAVYMHAYVCYY